MLMAMLVERSYVAQGIVIDCNTVLANSDQHREKLDYFTEFIKDRIKAKEGGKIKKTEVMEDFKKWYLVNHGKGGPKGREITEFMDNRYGVYNNGWHNVAISYDEAEDIDM